MRTSASRRGSGDLGASQADDEALDRLAAEVAELTRRVEQLDSIGEQSARVVERAVLEGLADFGKQLTAKAPKQGKSSKRLCRSIDALAAAIAAADARSTALSPAPRTSAPSPKADPNDCGPPSGGPQVVRPRGECYLRFFCLAIAPATRSPVMNMWL